MAPSSPVRSYVRKDPAEWQNDGWTSCPNRILRDRDLPWELRGVWCWLASHTEAFEITGEVLWNAGPAGRDKSYGFLRALEERGLLTRHHEFDPTTGRPVIRYDLHHRPVPDEQRTARPSTAKPRDRKHPGVAARADSAFLDGQEPGPDQDIPDGSGMWEGIPDGPVPGGSGIPYKEENTTGEDHLGVGFVDAPASGEPSPTPPTPEIPYDPDNPRCKDHRHLAADERGEACGKCADVRKWQERKDAETSAQAATAAADAETRVRACPMCDSTGHRLDQHRFPVPASDPMAVCDHASPYQRPTEPVDPDPRPAAEHEPTSSAEVRERAKAIIRGSCRKPVAA